MVRLWRWFRSGGRSDEGGAVAMQNSPPSSKAAAAEQAADKWAKDGDRGDQDYYHVPGTGNPDLRDPPVLDGKPLPKSGKKSRSKPRPA